MLAATLCRGSDAADSSVKGYFGSFAPCIPAVGWTNAQGWRLCGTTWVTRISRDPECLRQELVESSPELRPLCVPLGDDSISFHLAAWKRLNDCSAAFFRQFHVSTRSPESFAFFRLWVRWRRYIRVLAGMGLGFAREEPNLATGNARCGIPQFFCSLQQSKTTRLD